MYEKLLLNLDKSKPATAQIKRNLKNMGEKITNLVKDPVWKRLEQINWKLAEKVVLEREETRKILNSLEESAKILGVDLTEQLKVMRVGLLK